LGRVDILVQSGRGVDPYFHHLVSGPPDGWRKIWFFLRNNTDALLPMFMGNRSIPQPNSGYGVVQKDLRRLQPRQEEIAARRATGQRAPADLFQL
jgi:hypothetical protein